ncbi:hypothetical protein [Achromobacter sp. SLBN-14]|uniref:hypothetical protein n=1 Tax=Achromobacter sp. SLBN-14 TaxID=2768442 RepID=UPI00115412A4|nr:hypothetical protein [Achromobacter sp. SLBN-14]
MPPSLCEIDWSATAAWVQAIGSIAAIGVAIWVPYDMDRKARVRSQEAERRRQRHTQISLLPTLYELRSKTADFLDEQSGEPSFLGVERDTSEFDSDFFALVPKFIDILRVAPDAGDIDEHLARISVSLFRVNDNLGQNTKLQRDGYHAAWINHKDLFIESAQSIHELVDMIIGRIETHET